MKDLTVFILTHNRPVMVQTAIESVLAQKPFDFTFIVSDNSDNNETEKVLKEKVYFEKINYYHTTANGADRWHDIFSRVETQYFMVFHDDDEMLPNMVNSLYNEIEKNKLAAIGGNAKVFKDGKFSHLYSKKGGVRVLNDFADFPKSWINTLVAPFPSYMYSKECIRVFPFDFPAGKFSDAVFIGNILLKIGSIGTVTEPLFIYNIHGGQDSAVYDYLSQYYLYRYYKNNSSKNTKILDKYRVYVLYCLVNSEFVTKNIISKIKLSLLFKYSKYYFFRFVLKVIIYHFRNFRIIFHKPSVKS